MQLSTRLGLALALSLVAVACAAPPIANDLGDDDDGEQSDSKITSGDKKKTPTKTAPDSPGGAQPEADNTTPPADNTTPGTGTPTTPPPAGGQCAQTADAEACFQCCDAASNGELAKADEVFGQCACEGECATACGNNACNGAEPSAACDTCVQQKCEPKADAACTSAACKAGQACLQASCDQKR